MDKTEYIWKVYVLPYERYCGVTRRDLQIRLNEHAKLGRNILKAKVIREFDNETDALIYERHIQLKYNYKGYVFTEEWRNLQRQKIKEHGEESIYKLIRKPIICNENGVVFDGVRSCEKFFNMKSGNLTKHLQRDPNHSTFCGLTFSYYLSSTCEFKWVQSGKGIKYFPLKGINPNNKTKNKWRKKVIDIKSNIIYDSLREAGEANGIKKTTLSMMLVGSNPNYTNLRYYEG